MREVGPLDIAAEGHDSSTAFGRAGHGPGDSDRRAVVKWGADLHFPVNIVPTFRPARSTYVS